MDEAAALGRLIRESRLKKGMSLGQLASAVGRSSSSVRRWERGEVAPAIGILPQLARVLNVDEVELRGMRPSASPTSAEPVGTTAAPPEREVTVENAVVNGGTGAVSDPRAGIVVDATARQSGIVGRLWHTIFRKKGSWIGWVRGLMTAIALIAMFVILVWALGELLAALGAIIDSFDAG